MSSAAMPGWNVRFWRKADILRVLTSVAVPDSAPRKLSSAALLFDRVPNHCRDVRPVKPGDGADAGRRSDVDLGEKTVDDVDEDEQQTALAQLGRKRRADFALARGEVGGLRRTAAHHVGAQVVGRRYAVDGAGEFAVDQDEALVAVLDLGNKALDHPGL